MLESRLTIKLYFNRGCLESRNRRFKFANTKLTNSSNRESNHDSSIHPCTRGIPGGDRYSKYFLTWRPRSRNFSWPRFIYLQLAGAAASILRKKKKKRGGGRKKKLRRANKSDFNRKVFHTMAVPRFLMICGGKKWPLLFNGAPPKRPLYPLANIHGNKRKCFANWR